MGKRWWTLIAEVAVALAKALVKRPKAPPGAGGVR